MSDTPLFPEPFDWGPILAAAEEDNVSCECYFITREEFEAGCGDGVEYAIDIEDDVDEEITSILLLGDRPRRARVEY